MSNQFLPEELLELKNGLVLHLRPSNCKRYGLEPYSISTEEFSYRVKQGTNTKVGYHPEQCGKSTQHWYTCKLNQKDGETGDVKRITRFVTKKPGWIGQSGIFPGDCEYFAQRLDDVRKHFLSQHPGISRDFIYKCSICSYENKSITGVRKHMDSCTDITKWVKGVATPTRYVPCL
jgi:hypothetical protein